MSAWGVVEVDRSESETTGVRGWEQAGYHGLSYGGRWYRLRRWAIEYRKIPGDPGTPEPWDQLAQMMESPREHASGCLLRPVIVGIAVVTTPNRWLTSPSHAARATSVSRDCRRPDSAVS